VQADSWYTNTPDVEDEMETRDDRPMNGVAHMPRHMLSAALLVAAFATAQQTAAQQGAPPRPATATPTAQPGTATYVEKATVDQTFVKGGRLSIGADHNASVLRRTSAGQAEVHVKETDIFYIVDGEATFVTGGRMIGGKETRPNQLLGTDIEGGQVHHLKKGDFVAIPAGVPHWFKDVPTSINYYMVKVIAP
jgi:mannose-6-phosphate isomerase-like protein (cupin superfamily)